MTKYEALRITKKGTRFAITGLIIGLLANFNHGSGLILITSYVLWALFHGVQMVQPLVLRVYDFGPVKLEVTSISELFRKSFQLKILRLILLIVGGYFIGVFGGAIIRQIYLWIVILNE